MDNIGIYIIKNPSGSIYIGKTINLKKRLEKYRNGHCKSQINLYRSFCRYGFDSHEIKMLHELPLDIDNSALNTYEIFYINHYRNAGFKLMNLTSGGEGLLGKKHTLETIAKMKLSASGRQFSETAKQNALKYHSGRKMPQDQRDKISVANKGKTNSISHRTKISESKTGIVFTDEHRRKLSESHKGKHPWNFGLSGYKKQKYE